MCIYVGDICFYFFTSFYLSFRRVASSCLPSPFLSDDVSALCRHKEYQKMLRFIPLASVKDGHVFKQACLQASDSILGKNLRGSDWSYKKPQHGSEYLKRIYALRS